MRVVPRSDGVIYRICNFCAFVFKFFSCSLCAGLACVGSARNAHGCFLCGCIPRTSLSLSLLIAASRGWIFTKLCDKRFFVAHALRPQTTLFPDLSFHGATCFPVMPATFKQRSNWSRQMFAVKSFDCLLLIIRCLE